MRILVAYLATPGGADALAIGVRIARTLQAELDICMVLPRDRLADALVPSGGYDDVLAQQARGWLSEALASLPGDLAVDTHVSFAESFAEGIIAEATRLGSATIVVGGSGGGLMGSLTLGSVVNELLHSAPIPVVLAPRGARHSRIDRVRELTCAIGTRPGADYLLKTALRSSVRAGIPLRLVSLVALDEVHGADPAGDARAHRAAVEHAERTLHTAKATLPENFPVTSRTVDGASVEAAINELEWHDGDMIMVGSSRLGQPKRLFLGSTAAKMLRVLQVPMAVVPREEVADDVG